MANVYRSRSKNGKLHPKWRFQYVDWTGKRRTATGSTSKADTEKFAASIEAEQDAIRKGLKPPPKSFLKHRQRPFDEVAAEYQSWGESQGGRGGRPWSRQYATKRRSFLAWWKERLSLDTLVDLEGVLPRVEHALRELQAKGRKGKTLQGKSLQHFAQALQSFCLWAKKRGYLDTDPLDGLATFDTTPKTKRRALRVEEIHRLLSAAPNERRLLYGVAFCTGLRANELRNLCVSDLSVDRCGLLLHAEWTKNRKHGFQPLPAALVEQLKASTEGQPADAPLLRVPAHPDRVILRDLKAAKVARWTPEGKVDFHAVRVAYVSLVLDAGAGVKEVQTLARHSTPTMTMNVYGRTRGDRLRDLTEAVGGAILPEKCRAFAERKAVGFSSSLISRRCGRQAGGSNPLTPTSSTPGR